MHCELGAGTHRRRNPSLGWLESFHLVHGRPRHTRIPPQDGCIPNNLDAMGLFHRIAVGPEVVLFELLLQRL